MLASKIPQTTIFEHISAKDIDSFHEIIIAERQANKKVQSIKDLTGMDNSVTEWLNKVGFLLQNQCNFQITADEKLSSLNKIGSKWNQENFHKFMSLLSDMTSDQAHSFFDWCLEWVLLRSLFFIVKLIGCKQRLAERICNVRRQKAVGILHDFYLKFFSGQLRRD